MGCSAPRRPVFSHPLLYVLLLALPLFAWGISWGLPSRLGWAGDEIMPRAVEQAARRGFAAGWHTKYPPVHYMVLAALHAPVRALAGEETSPAELDHRLILASRWLSVLMALGAVWAVYRAAREATDRRGAALAALAVALMPPFVYFAKTANPEMPMLFWLALSLWLYLQSSAATACATGSSSPSPPPSPSAPRTRPTASTSSPPSPSSPP